MRFGSIEAGGTKFVCAVGDEHLNVIDVAYFPTTTPKETLDACIRYFDINSVDALSIASFGPIELRADNPYYGYITTTPKAGWRYTNFVGAMRQRLGVPIYWTTDVNASAYGEYLEATRMDSRVHALTYYTIGTGVGAGTVIDNHFLGTIGHAEMGHVFVKRHPDDLLFHGVCVFHGDCLEGLVSGPSFDARLGESGKDVPLIHPVWDIMAYYVAQAAIQTTLTLRPNKIVFGGGVSSEGFLKKVRTHFEVLLNDYVAVPDLNQYITMPVVKGNGSATVGNFALSARLLAN